MGEKDNIILFPSERVKPAKAIPPRKVVYFRGKPVEVVPGPIDLQSYLKNRIGLIRRKIGQTATVIQRLK